MTTVIFSFVILIYALLIGGLIYGFDKVTGTKLQDLKAKTKFSIIIPFRDEAKNLPALLKSIERLNYPKSFFEVLLVDDASTDDSLAVIRNFMEIEASNKDVSLATHIRVIKNTRLTNSPKKDAINSAIAVSKYDWIITTDADCIVPKFWLDAFDECIQLREVNCIVGPVTYDAYGSFFNRFQALDFLSLQGSTIGGFGIKKPILCNGANFGYKKSVFKTLQGFEGNLHMASGDDIFLLQKLVKYCPEHIQYLKSNKAIVVTKPVKTLKLLIEQRLRWASKISAYNSWLAKCIGCIVLLANMVCLFLLPMIIFELISLRSGVALIVIKFSIDFLLLFKTSRFFKQESILLSYIFSSMVYPFFSIYIAGLSLFSSFNWKGRQFKK
ncbi:MAG: glycosyltransferase [Winogradskyella sp.]|uniref:glycosyltransferase n=1 Tax=Winogradskyella sp. TaxID=1883156 RepID=UPI0017AE47ED|nr:glycosyltransferase [Winogradskyella sp.]